MSFQLTSEQKMIQKEVRDFAQKEIEPLAPEIEEKGEYPKDIMENISGLGLTGLAVCEEFGGSKMDYISLVLALREIAGFSPALAFMVSIQNIAGFTLEKIIKFHESSSTLQCATAALKQYLEGICSGKKVAALALDKTQIKLEAKEGVINGSCDYVLNSSAADLFIIPGTACGSQLFVIDKACRGFKLDAKRELIGLRPVNAHRLVFDNCKTAPENILTDENESGKITSEIFCLEKLCTSAILLGLSRASFDAALKYSKERRQFGKLICEFDLVQEMLANMDMEIAALEAFIYFTASKLDEGDCHADKTANLKLFASRCAYLCTKNAIQIYGGYGYSKDYPLERFMRDAKVLEVLSGAKAAQILDASEKITVKK